MKSAICLFSAANLARHVKADPEAAIRRANAKFERRFRFIEEELARDGRRSGTVRSTKWRRFGTPPRPGKIVQLAPMEPVWFETITA